MIQNQDIKAQKNKFTAVYWKETPQGMMGIISQQQLIALVTTATADFNRDELIKTNKGHSELDLLIWIWLQLSDGSY